MTARLFGIFLWLLSTTAAVAADVEEWSHSAAVWRQLSRGLSFAEVQVFRDDHPVETLTVVKIDPAHNAFRVFHHAPQSLAHWQEETQAAVLFNASYYCQDNKPCGLIVKDGELVGPRHNSRMRGMFVAEPKGVSPDLPRATILDLVNHPINPDNLPWTQGVQSFPLLLDSQGRVRVRNSSKTSHRTVIATDHGGNILIFNTASGFFTLYDLSQFLKNSDFDIDLALNLDGGTEAQLLIKTKDLEHYSPSSWEAALGNLMDRAEFRLPTVVGVFPRQE